MTKLKLKSPQVATEGVDPRLREVCETLHGRHLLIFFILILVFTLHEKKKLRFEAGVNVTAVGV